MKTKVRLLLLAFVLFVAASFSAPKVTEAGVLCRNCVRDCEATGVPSDECCELYCFDVCLYCA